MIENWKNVTVSNILLACYVPPGTGAITHKDRPTHGFVLNDSDKQADYHFSDGTLLKTFENNLFYLPKGSTYEVKEIKSGGCYAINFDADIFDTPFSVNFRHHERLFKIFKDSERDWQTNHPFYQLSIKRTVYEIIFMLMIEQQKNYLPSRKEQIILPALEKIKSDIDNPDLSVTELSKICNISEVYFRKIFIEKFGISPKEYIIDVRINQAKDLLKSGLFSVSDVAKFCGYTEPCHFSREFKKRTGESPANYK